MDMTEVKRFDAQVGTLKLSAAMRVGAKLRPQGRECLFLLGKTCAIGAAMEGRGWIPITMCGDDDLKKYVPELLFNNSSHPSDLFGRIGQRNDNGESRESIADWLESQGY